MKLDDAYYHLLLLQSGLDDGYDTWLDGYLEEEDPLSDIVLNLASCGSNVNETISCLNAYCGPKPYVNERQLCDRLRNYMKDAYQSGQMSQREVVDAMHRIAMAHGAPWDVEADIWDEFYYMEDRLDLVDDGFASREVFDSAFQAFLDDGIYCEETHWECRPSRKERFRSWLHSVMPLLKHK